MNSALLFWVKDDVHDYNRAAVVPREYSDVTSQHFCYTTAFVLQALPLWNPTCGVLAVTMNNAKDTKSHETVFNKHLY